MNYMQKYNNLSDYINNLYDKMKSEGILDNGFNYMLIRRKDGLVKTSKDIKWVDTSNDQLLDEPKVGLSLLMSPFNYHFTWVTTNILKIIEHNDVLVHFKTNNSEYKLYKDNKDIYNSEVFEKRFKEW